MAGVVGKSVVSTEAGHINITDKASKPELKKNCRKFHPKNSRMPTYEDFLSEKGLSISIRSYPIKLQIYPMKIYFKEEMMKIV